MYCRKCGSEIPEGESVCQRCGTIEGQAPTPQKKPKKKWWGILAFAIIIVIAVICTSDDFKSEVKHGYADSSISGEWESFLFKGDDEWIDDDSMRCQINSDGSASLKFVHSEDALNFYWSYDPEWTEESRKEGDTSGYMYVLWLTEEHEISVGWAMLEDENLLLSIHHTKDTTKTMNFLMNRSNS